MSTGPEEPRGKPKAPHRLPRSMGRGWAVGASTALGLSVAQGVLHVRELGQGPAGMEHPLFLIETIMLVALFAAWSYAISVGSYGSKGALVALLGYALVFAALLQGILAFLPGYDAHPTLVSALAFLNLAVGAGTTASLLREIRSRRGPVQWGTAAFFLAPLAVWIVLALAAR